MESDLSNAVPKVHPASREVLPEDPMEMTGFEIPGDPEIMLRMLVEEYARIGFGVREIMQLAGDANFRAFHGLQKRFGEEGLKNRVAEILSRCGVLRVTVKETAAVPDCLVQLELPKTKNICQGA